MEVKEVEITKKEKIYELTESEFKNLKRECRAYGSRKTREYIAFCYLNYRLKMNFGGAVEFLSDLAKFLGGYDYIPSDIGMNNSEYFRVYLKYKNMSDSIKKKLTNSDGDSNIRCRIMAKLSTADISVTPSINSIKVIGE